MISCTDYSATLFKCLPGVPYVTRVCNRLARHLQVTVSQGLGAPKLV
jgi:hypothetical protein